MTDVETLGRYRDPRTHMLRHDQLNLPDHQATFRTDLKTATNMDQRLQSEISRPFAVKAGAIIGGPTPT